MELSPQDQPSMKNIYQSSYLDKVRMQEQQKANKNFEMAKNPRKYGVVPQPAFSSMFHQSIDNGGVTSGENISLLSGVSIDKSKFSHNNMQPFIKGNVTQNTDIEKFTARLDYNTGVDKLHKGKREVINTNISSTNMHNVNGAKPVTDFLKNRLNVSTVMNNVLPFEQYNVGPGLNKGYTTSGSGGYQQIDTRKYALPKSLDELRSKTNQKSGVFEIPVQGPKTGTTQRAVVMPLKKNKPETSYEHGILNWFKSKAAVTKDTARSELAIKDTHRQTSHVEYQGAGKYVSAPGAGEKDDYGKSKIIVYDNERNSSETQTPVANFSSVMKAAMSPLFDALKLSLKEYTVDAPRAVGNASIQMPNKMTVQDKNDIMKTTVKETTIHDSENLNLSGHDGTYSAIQDIAKTTVKETTIHDGDTLNLSAPSATYTAPEDDMKTTIRQTLPVVETTRNIGRGTFRVCTYHPDIAKRTTKETTIKGTTELGFISGVINSILGGYATKEVDLRNSHKQFTVDNENIGIAGAVYEHRQVSREAEENAEIDGSREQMLIDAGGTPNPGRVNIPVDKEDINFKSNKLIEDSYSQRDMGNVGIIYQSSPEANECIYTREQNKANAYEDRLDGSIMQSLNNNDLSIKINPIKAI